VAATASAAVLKIGNLVGAVLERTGRPCRGVTPATTLGGRSRARVWLWRGAEFAGDALDEGPWFREVTMMDMERNGC